VIKEEKGKLMVLSKFIMTRIYVSLFLFSFLCSWSSMVSQEPLADVIVELLGVRYCVYNVISIAGFIIS